MSRLYAVLIFLVIPCVVFAQESVQLGAQTFEANDWQIEFTGTDWIGKTIRVTNNPYAGSYSLRWNMDDDNGRADPITGAPGYGNSHLDWRGVNRDFATATPNGAYFRFAFRHDDYNNDATDANSSRKMFYIVDNVYGVGGMYIKLQNGTWRPRISCCNGAYSTTWYNTNWGYNYLNLLGGAAPALDGTWHTFAVYWNYVEKYMQFWMDDVLLQPQDSGGDYENNFPVLAAEKKVPWNPSQNFNTKGIQLFYYDADRDLINPVDRTGYYAGIQIDNLEFWDGIPDSTFTPPDPLTTITRPDNLQVVE